VIPDAVDGDGRLGDVRRQHHLPVVANKFMSQKVSINQFREFNTPQNREFHI
jgi:hypothetical protein